MRQLPTRRVESRASGILVISARRNVASNNDLRPPPQPGIPRLPVNLRFVWCGGLHQDRVLLRRPSGGDPNVRTCVTRRGWLSGHKRRRPLLVGRRWRQGSCIGQTPQKLVEIVPRLANIAKNKFVGRAPESANIARIDRVRVHGSTESTKSSWVEFGVAGPSRKLGGESSSRRCLESRKRKSMPKEISHPYPAKDFGPFVLHTLR